MAVSTSTGQIEWPSHGAATDTITSSEQLSMLVGRAQRACGRGCCEKNFFKKRILFYNFTFFTEITSTSIEHRLRASYIEIVRRCIAYVHIQGNGVQIKQPAPLRRCYPFHHHSNCSKRRPQLKSLDVLKKTGQVQN